MATVRPCIPRASCVPCGPLLRCQRAEKLGIAESRAAGRAGGGNHNLIAAVWLRHGACEILVDVSR
jgi:hypothetical protein